MCSVGAHAVWPTSKKFLEVPADNAELMSHHETKASNTTQTLTRGQSHDGVLCLLVDDGGHAASRPTDLAALAGHQLNIVDGHANGNVLWRCADTHMGHNARAKVGSCRRVYSCATCRTQRSRHTLQHQQSKSTAACTCLPASHPRHSPAHHTPAARHIP